MDSSTTVFTSKITRVGNHHKNNLYDLLNIVPAKPLKVNETKKYTCDYIPKTGKYYTPKRKSRLKVKTVRDIRKLFEQDTFSYLLNELETQQNTLLKKIRHGSSSDEITKNLATKLLRGDSPITRSTWQMLINLNPEHHKNPRQFVKWNGKYIQVNGSLGGRKQIINNYDLSFKSPPQQNTKKHILKNNFGIRKKGLLRNSLVVQFKPGPLCKKQFLDDSPQKYHIGNTELIHLPKPGLDIKPTYGTASEPMISQYLNNLRPGDGSITGKWAEFAVSVLGTIKKSNAVQINKDCITFDLAYKYNQNKLLMRRGADNLLNTSEYSGLRVTERDRRTARTGLKTEILDIINKMIDSVEINLTQDTLFTQEKETEPLTDLNSMDVTNAKDKLKRKFGELDRLAVRVITLNEIEEPQITKSCNNKHCSLGCICASLQGKYNLRQHCGRIECIFDCKCGYDMYKDNPLHAECSDLLPGLININNDDLHLAKEEQKFHQTVIVAGKKRILLKTEKRNSKPSKKYADFYSNVTSKQEQHKRLDASVVAIKFDCNNIEPWCMVHNLYKCFCKGKFTETCANISEDIGKESLSKETTNDAEDLENLKGANDDTGIEECPSARMKEQQKSTEWTNSVRKSKILESIPKKVNKSRSFDKLKYNSNTEENNYDSENEIKSHSNAETTGIQRNKNSRYTLRQLKMTNFNRDTDKSSEKSFYSDDSNSLDYMDEETNTCSRTSAYVGRKYTNGYYKNTNSKILEMEKHDKKLQERLDSINLKIDSEKTKTTDKTANDSENLSEIDKKSRKRLLSETKLVSWLESNYKIYKQRNDRGFLKNALEPPQLGKVALHSWEFILTRYRERKNLFLVSRQKPFRIFMAVNTNNSFFTNCININDIRFAELHKYPQTVKNLLINATDLKDNFCILRGLSFCWELIGSVTKVSESDGSGAEHDASPKINMNPQDESDTDMSADFNQNNAVSEESLTENTEQTEIQTSPLQKKDSESKSCVDYVGSSKWFVMTIENDFSEIRFFRKGFFVKYESIINAISVARLSGKTVRLSSKKCMEQPEVPQFGIYAIPNNNEYCVFVGPYEMEDTLGIETIKTILDVRNVRVKRTRGFWITTNKIDNLKVVENPLSFVPSTNTQNNSEIPLEAHLCTNLETNLNQQDNTKLPESVVTNQNEETKECSPSKRDIKVVKPIKIRKTNGFYHLASDGVLKKISLKYPKIAPKPVITRINVGDCVMDNTRSLLQICKTGIDNNINGGTSLLTTSQEPVTEAVSQIKIASVYSTQNEPSVSNPSKPPVTIKDRGMFILKPEEINRKVIQNELMAEVTSASRNKYEFNNKSKSMFLDSNNYKIMPESTDWNADDVNVYVLSDEENERTSETIDQGEIEDNGQLWTDVCIECTNVPSLGWIPGIKNFHNLLSFKLPGSEYSEFYPEEKAFAEINLELSKRINTSMNITLQWKVNDSSDKFEGTEINPEHLYPDYILTPEGLLHTSDIIKSNKDNLKTYSKTNLKGNARGSASPSEIGKINLLKQIEEPRKTGDVHH
ncbi:hypothetical protein B5X24_HaOG211608 [Helicoverpa armigera]|nr:hypothetical protein B5X24_HaOG211608 [Helicoverpa armigera]